MKKGQPQQRPVLSQLPIPASSWFAADPSKAYYEKCSLIWAPLSMLAVLAGLIGTGYYERCQRNEYLIISSTACLPGIIIPLIFPCRADRGRPYSRRFWVKGTLWISIFGFYGNYFWTHYFYELLGAQYHFDSYRFNDVPIVTFTCTFFYFTFYFSFVNIILRRIANSTADLPDFAKGLLWWSNICALAYGTALFEAITVQHFPLYTYKERDAFLLIGSVVYGLYFVVGFPMFFSLDERYTQSGTIAPARVSLKYTAMNAFAATAIVTLLLDLWRLFLGSIYALGNGEIVQVPFIYQKKGKECPPAVVSCESVIDAKKCKHVAQECAQRAMSWAYRQVSTIADRMQRQADDLSKSLNWAADSGNGVVMPAEEL